MVKSFKTGWSSVVSNRVPMVVLWTLAALTVWAYYAVPSVTAAFEPLAKWQRESGWLAAFANRFIFCGLLPGAFMLAMKSLKVPRPLLVIAVQTLWSGLCGIVSGWMFTFHAWLFGEGIDFTTLCLKTAMQQFVWTPLYFAPVGALVYFWMGRDFSFARTRAELPRHFFRETVLPNLFANWIIWIPIGIVIHMFPTPLQIQMAGFANAFLCLVLLTLGKR